MSDHVKVSEEISAPIGDARGLSLGTSEGKSAACLVLMAELLQAGRGAGPYEVITGPDAGGEDE